MVFKKKSAKAEIKQESIRDKMQVEDLEPRWALEQKCFEDAGEITDARTGKAAGLWPRDKSVPEIQYDNWLDSVIDVNTGQWYPERDSNGTPIKNTGGHYVPNLLVRIRDGDNEYLCSKGDDIGYNAAGIMQKLHVMYPERYKRTLFTHKKKYDEKSMTFKNELQGPERTEWTYTLPFIPENVDILYQKSDKKKLLFLVKDEPTQETRQVKSSSLDNTLKLFKEKDFDYLFQANYMTSEQKEENRREAIMRGQIPGVSASTLYAPKEGIAKNMEYLK